MSATNRGAVRQERDFYATPEAAFMPLLPFLASFEVRIWEPACGDERLINWMRVHLVHGAWGDDLNAGYDFLKDWCRHDAIVTNPPFSLALEFCDHALAVSDHVVMLLRLNFLASKKRRDWWRAHEPSAILILSERPSFTGDGKTDATDYGWFCWSDKLNGIHHL